MGDEERTDDQIPVEGSEQDQGADPDFDDVTIEEGIEEDEPEKAEKPAAKTAEKPSKDQDDPIKIELERMKSKISDLNKALHEERKSKREAAKDEAPQLSDAEIKKLFKEYQDDPDTLFQIVKYTAEQAAKGASKDAVDKGKIAENRKETESFLQKNYPDVYKEDSELHQYVSKTKTEMGLADHPYGDFLGTAVQVLINAPNIMKQVYDRGRNDALGGKAEKTRKEIVKESGLTPKGRSVGAESGKLTDAQKDVAQRLGLTGNKLKAFEKIVSKNAKMITVEG